MFFRRWTCPGRRRNRRWSQSSQTSQSSRGRRGAAYSVAHGSKVPARAKVPVSATELARRFEQARILSPRAQTGLLTISSWGPHESGRVWIHVPTMIWGSAVRITSKAGTPTPHRAHKSMSTSRREGKSAAELERSPSTGSSLNRWRSSIKFMFDQMSIRPVITRQQHVYV